MSGPIIGDTDRLLKALAHTLDHKPSFPEYQAVLTDAGVVIVPALVLAEVDYFLRDNRAVMRKLIAEIFDPGPATSTATAAFRSRSHARI